MLQQFDYIIAGAGCAGLSLAVHLVQSPALQRKKILLVDEAPKDKNDRTWCFWEVEDGLFQPVVHRQWDKLWFYGEGVAKEFSIAPYRYKMIRGVDFYNHCFAQLRQHPNVEFLHGKVERLLSGERSGVVVNGETYEAGTVFNSILFEKPTLQPKHNWLLQHFKGWQVRTEAPAFQPGAATLMDFRISQKHGTAFCYVLPQSATEALVEYTLFTPSLLSDESYDEGLREYVEGILGIRNYTVVDTEFGVIPMTNYRFPVGEKNIVNIGTAGGQTKGSSGYTFYFIQQHCKRIVQALETGGPLLRSGTSPRFHFYDSVLLQVLQNGQPSGREIFSTLFRKNNVQDVLTFLNNASTLGQELKIISSLPTLPFLKAAVQQGV